MTLVIRITLSLLAVVTLVTFTADADGQIFRRMRDNIRSNYSPQSPVAPVQIAPQPIRPGQVVRQPQYGQSLTPYSRLTPDQRNPSVIAQPNRNVNPANQNAQSDQVNIRVVTYYDPRTGRTYQRRFLIPSNNGAANPTGDQKVAGGNPPASTPTMPRKPVYDKIPKPVAVNPPQQLNARPSVSVLQQPKFNIPPIRVNQVPTQIQQPTITGQQLPTLAGPQTIVAAPGITAAPAIASPEAVTTTTQSPTQPQEPPLGITIAEDPINAGSDVQIDTAVVPAAVNSNDISIGSPASEGVPPNAFSVLEGPEDSEEQASEDLDIEIDSSDEVEAFFGQ